MSTNQKASFAKGVGGSAVEMRVLCVEKPALQTFELERREQVAAESRMQMSGAEGGAKLSTWELA